jgi:hypothetical protein
MATNKIYEITNWNQHFEKAQTRSKPVAKHSWVAMPNKHEGLGFKKIMRDDRGLEIFAVWVLMVQIASKAKPRGRLADEDGEPYSFDDIALKSCCKTEAVEYAIPFLIALKWVTHRSITTVSTQYHSGITAVGTTLHNITEQDNTKQENTIQNKTAFFPDGDNSKNDSIKMFATGYQRVEVFKIVAKVLPKNRMKSPVLLCASIVAAINRSNATNEAEREQAAHLLAERIGAYYDSTEGKGGHHKDPDKWLDEDRHLVDVSVWESRAKQKPTSGWDSIERVES